MSQWQIEAQMVLREYVAEQTVLLRHPNRLIVAAVLSATMIAAGPTIPQIDVKDRHGITVLTISKIQMFRSSAPVFQAVVKNVSGDYLYELKTINGTIHKKDGSVERFQFSVDPNKNLAIGGLKLPSVLSGMWNSGQELKVTYKFPKPWPFSAADFFSVDFSVPDSWQSPEDKRIDTEQRRKADADRGQLIRELGRRLCADVYKRTADKKVSDLTVKEQQQVQSCQAEHLYGP